MLSAIKYIMSGLQILQDLTGFINTNNIISWMGTQIKHIPYAIVLSLTNMHTTKLHAEISIK